MSYTLGVDFDNTLVNYDDVLWRTARQMGLVTGLTKHKKNIRDAIRQVPDGERKWQRLQACVYGKAMDEAVLIQGVKSFFKFCKSAGLSIYIVSHKTEFAVGDNKVNLHGAALKWMGKNKFFDSEGLGLSASQVYFEPTRAKKIERIKALGCTHFIDDLEETFLEKSFPAGVDRILYSPQSEDSLPDGRVRVFRSWEEINNYFMRRR